MLRSGFLSSSGARWAILGRLRGGFPDNAFAVAVRSEMNKGVHLLVQPSNGFVKAIRGFAAVFASNWIVDAWRPAFFLKSRQNGFLVLGRLMKTLYDDVAKSEFATGTVPNWSNTGLRSAVERKAFALLCGFVLGRELPRHWDPRFGKAETTFGKKAQTGILPKRAPFGARTLFLDGMLHVSLGDQPAQGSPRTADFEKSRQLHRKLPLILWELLGVIVSFKENRQDLLYRRREQLRRKRRGGMDRCRFHGRSYLFCGLRISSEAMRRSRAKNCDVHSQQTSFCRGHTSRYLSNGPRVLVSPARA
jgi:hypothetical protein